jgi:catecholate siderophore receptor
MAYIKARKRAVARAVPPFSSAAAATLMAIAAPAAWAQSTLPEIRVQDSSVTDYKTDTSANVKFTAPLVNTPQTVQVIKEQVIRDQGATTLTEALRNSPGVGTFFLGENGNTTTGDAIFMRGFDSSSAIFVDGVRDLGSVSRDTFNLEQVEVVKGPAGTDVGRTSPTGYINLVTKKPTLENSFSGSLGFGSADFKRGSVDWNRSLSGENGIGAAFRLNAVAEDAGVPGRDLVKNKRWGIAPSFAFGLNSPTRFYFDLVHVKQNNVPDGGVPTIGLPGYSSPDPKRGYLSAAQRVDSRNFYGTSSDFDNVSTDMFTARVEHDLTPDVTIRNTTRFAKTQQDYMLNAFMSSTANLVTPNALLPLGWTVARSIPTNKDQENTIFTNQTNVSAKFNTGSVGHSLNAGLELIREKQDSNSYYGQNARVFNVPGIANSGAWPAANLYAPNPHVFGYNRIQNGATASGETTTIGAYVFDTVKFNEQWMLTGGLRYDHYSTRYDATALNATSGVLTPTNLKLSDNLVSGKLGLVYKPTANSSIYAAYGTAAQPPGGANFQLAAGGTGSNAGRTDFLPQKAKTYEIGTKWDVLDKRVALTAALYRTEVSNEVVQDAVTSEYFQTGKKRVQGIELGVSGAITDNWGITSGFTTMNTRVQSGPSVLADGSTALAYTPKNAFTLWSTYQLPFGLTVGGGARYNGKLLRGRDGAVGTPAYVDSYWVFDAMASYRINKNVDIQFNVYNLFDKEYVASINKSGYRYTPGAPRTYKVTANFAF